MPVKLSLSPHRFRRGFTVVGALLLLLFAMLAAGFTFYCGIRIVDYIRRLQQKREDEIRKIEDLRDGNDQGIRPGDTNHVLRVSFDRPTPV